MQLHYCEACRSVAKLMLRPAVLHVHFTIVSMAYSNVAIALVYVYTATVHTEALLTLP